MDEKKQAALEYLIHRKLLTADEFKSLKPHEIFKAVKAKRKHQLKELELLATKALAGQI